VPAKGRLVRSKTGRIVYRVEAVSLHRRVDQPVTKARVRLVLRRLRAAEIPEGEDVLSWPVAAPARAASAPPAPPQPDGQEEATSAPVGAPRPAGGAAARRARQRGRQTQRGAYRPPDAATLAIPEASRQDVRDAAGRLIRPARVERQSWRDPEDTNVSAGSPKLVRGWVASDGIARLAQINSHITEDMVVAADCYRMAWERAHRSPGGARFERYDGGDATRGPTDEQMMAIRAWQQVQAILHADARSLLESVVLRRGYVSDWAIEWGAAREYAVGLLIGVLGQLVVYYWGAIQEIRNDRVVMEKA